MELISINIGQKQIQQNGGKSETTGIYKIPVQEAVQITALGIPGDFIGSQKHHGGPDQAVYIYGMEDYAWWSQALGRAIGPGIFGDNLTISGLESSRFNIGDILHLGGVTLQVSAPRIPCATFAARMQDPGWVRKFRKGERPGLYCRVLQEGNIKAGQEVRLEAYPGETISVLQMFRGYYERRRSEETLRRHLNAPIAIRARNALEKESARYLS